MEIPDKTEPDKTEPDKTEPDTLDDQKSRRAWTILGRLSHAMREQNWAAVVLELAIVILGVVIGFQISAWGQERSERAVAADYLVRFAEDFNRDLAMLDANIESREAQVNAATEALSFYEGRPLDVDQFFDAFYTSILLRGIAPNRNTMDEVLNSGSLRLIDDSATREAILDVYAAYESINRLEDHIRRDIERYSYDPTFSSIRLKYPGPWAGKPEYRQAAEELLTNLTVENGLRLILVNVQSDGALIDMLRNTKSDVRNLFERLGTDQSS